MFSLTTSRQIQAPIETVFRVFTDLENAGTTIPAIKKMEMLTPAPVCKGTRWKETRVLFGKEATETMEITRFDPPRGYTVEAESCGTHYTTTFVFRPEGGEAGGTHAEMTFRGQPLTTAARVMGAVMGLMMKGMMRKLLNSDMDSLKAACEREPAAGASIPGAVS